MCVYGWLDGHRQTQYRLMVMIFVLGVKSMSLKEKQQKGNVTDCLSSTFVQMSENVSLDNVIQVFVDPVIKNLVQHLESRPTNDSNI